MKSFAILSLIVTIVVIAGFALRQGGVVGWQYVGTTSSIGGSLLLAGACSTGTVSIIGVTPGMPVTVSPSDGTNIPALGLAMSGVVTSNGVVTVNVCALLSVTPTAKTYNVRVLP